MKKLTVVLAIALMAGVVKADDLVPKQLGRRSWPNAGLQGLYRLSPSNQAA